MVFGLALLLLLLLLLPLEGTAGLELALAPAPPPPAPAPREEGACCRETLMAPLGAEGDGGGVVERTLASVDVVGERLLGRSMCAPNAAAAGERAGALPPPPVAAAAVAGFAASDLALKGGGVGGGTAADAAVRTAPPPPPLAMLRVSCWCSWRLTCAEALGGMRGRGRAGAEVVRSEVGGGGGGRAKEARG